MSRVRRLLLTGLLLVQPLAAQPTAPVLSKDVKTELQLAAKDVEILALRAQAAVLAFEQARAAFQALTAKYTPPGYQLNVERWVWEKRSEAPPAPDPAPPAPAQEK